MNEGIINQSIESINRQTIFFLADIQYKILANVIIDTFWDTGKTRKCHRYNIYACACFFRYYLCVKCLHHYSISLRDIPSTTKRHNTTHPPNKIIQNTTVLVPKIHNPRSENSQRFYRTVRTFIIIGRLVFRSHKTKQK